MKKRCRKKWIRGRWGLLTIGVLIAGLFTAFLHGADSRQVIDGQDSAGENLYVYVECLPGGVCYASAQEISLGEVLHISEDEAMKIQNDTAKIKQKLLSLGYECSVRSDGVIEATAEYVTKRLYVTGSKPWCTFGAIASTESGGVTLLEYTNPKMTKRASKIFRFLGKEVYPDKLFQGASSSQVIFHEDVLGEYGNVLEDASGYGQVSTPPQIMGLSECAAYLSSEKENVKDVTVAVIDSGIDTTNEIFKGRVLTGYNILDGSKNVVDDYGHGTFIASTIVNNTPSNVKILPIKLTDQNGTFSVVRLAVALSYVLQHSDEIDVVNISLSALLTDDVQKKQVTDFVLPYIEELYEKGVVIIASAGNKDAEDLTTSADSSFPACCDPVVCVSALGYEDGIWSLYSHSMYGSCVDFCAPGQYIRGVKASTMRMVEATSQNGFTAQWLDLGDGTCIMSGTSQATAYVSSAAALLCSFGDIKDADHLLANLSAYTRKNFLGGEKGEKDERYGYGCIDLTFYRGATQTPLQNTQAETHVTSQKKVTFRYAQDGITNRADYVAYVTEGSCVQEPEKPSVAGYYFDGWYTSGGKRFSFKKKITQNTILRANYISKTVKATKITFAKKVGTKKFRVICSGIEDADGYQFSFGKRLDFKGCASVKTTQIKRTFLTKSKGTYYVRVRAYKKLGGKTYYSKWSGVKKVKL